MKNQIKNKSKFIKIIDKLFHKQQITREELIIFIVNSHELIFPKPLTDEQLYKILNFPLLNNIIQYYINEIGYDPLLFGINMLKIYDSNGNLILIKITECQ